MLLLITNYLPCYIRYARWNMDKEIPLWIQSDHLTNVATAEQHLILCFYFYQRCKNNPRSENNPRCKNNPPTNQSDVMLGMKLNFVRCSNQLLFVPNFLWKTFVFFMQSNISKFFMQSNISNVKSWLVCGDKGWGIVETNQNTDMHLHINNIEAFLSTETALKAKIPILGDPAKIEMNFQTWLLQGGFLHSCHFYWRVFCHIVIPIAFSFSVCQTKNSVNFRNFSQFQSAKRHRVFWHRF